MLINAGRWGIPSAFFYKCKVMSDIITRLLLNTSDYDKNIGKAKQSASAFATELGGQVASAALKLAGAMAAVSGAASAFEGVIKGSQTTSDEFDRVMRSAKTTVESFFTAISTGDFTAFNRGLDDIIARARIANDALDQLGNTTMSYGYFSTRNQAEFAEAVTVLRDKNATTAEKNAAKATADKILGNQKEITDQLKERTQKAVSALVSEKNTLGLNNITRLNIDEILALDVSSMGDTMKADLATTYKEYEDIYNKAKEKHTTLEATSEIGKFNKVVNYTELNKEMEDITNKYQQAILYNEILVRNSDDWLKNLLSIYAASDNAERSLAGMEKMLNRVSQSEGGGTATKKKGMTMPVVVGQINYDTPLGGKVLKWMNGEDIPIVKVPIEIEDENIEEAPLPITKQSVKDVDDYVSSINALSNVMTALNTQTVEGAAGWLSWAGSLVTASAMAVDSIRKVVEAKTAEGAASAGAEAAKTPFVGWLLVGGAVMSALAAFASIPSFAEGGVVPGSNFRDGIAARLSSGEMVINPADQKRLYDSIHSGNMGGGASRSVITGEQIVTVVNNYGRRTGRGTILKG